MGTYVMDTYRAAAMAEEGKDGREMVFDWDKAATMITEHGASDAAALLGRDRPIPGPEYPYLRGLVYDLACVVLQPSSHRHELPRFLNRAHYLAGRDPDDPRWARDVETAFRTDAAGCALLCYRDRPLAAFALALNTVMAAGSDAVRLAARLTAQADIHAWGDGADRGWLAGLIDDGVHAGLLRSGLWRTDVHGVPESWSSSCWDGLAVFLRARDDEPVVTSYSVEGGFPAAEASDWLPPLPEGTSEDDLPERERAAREARYDAWAGLDDAEQWRLGLAWLRANPGLQMAPGHWGDARFGAGLSLFDLYAADAEYRLDRALGFSRVTTPGPLCRVPADRQVCGRDRRGT